SQRRHALIKDGVGQVAGRPRADGGPGNGTDAVGDELGRAVGETDVHAARVITAGGDVGGVEGGQVAAVVAVVIGRDGVGVIGQPRQAAVILQAAVADAVGRRVVPGVAAEGVAHEHGLGVGFVEQRPDLGTGEAVARVVGGDQVDV